MDSKTQSRTRNTSKSHKLTVKIVIKYMFCRAEEEGEDIVDSDFSIDENDEPVSDNEEGGQKKKRRLITKAYKVFLRSLLFI